MQCSSSCKCNSALSLSLSLEWLLCLCACVVSGAIQFGISCFACLQIHTHGVYKYVSTALNSCRVRDSIQLFISFESSRPRVISATVVWPGSSGEFLVVSLLQLLKSNS